MAFDLEIGIYNTHILFLVGTTLSQYKKVYEKNKDAITEEENDGIIKDIQRPKSCDGFTLSCDNGDYVVYLRQENPKVGNVAHEIFHVANKILYHRGVTYDSDAEAWAYLIGFITQRFYRALAHDTKLKEKKQKQKKDTANE